MALAPLPGPDAMKNRVEIRHLSITRRARRSLHFSCRPWNWPDRPPNRPQEGKGSLETPKTDPAIDSLRRPAVGSFLLWMVSA